MGDIVNIETFRIRSALNNFNTTGKISNYLIDGDCVTKKAALIGGPDVTESISTILAQSKVDEFINLQSTFNYDYAYLKDNMHTRSTDFMYPGILNRYRRGINPVAALYNSLQEALFKYDETNKHYVWIVSLFADSDWIANLYEALDSDVTRITSIISKYRASNSAFINKKLKRLQKLKETFLQFIEVFGMVQEWIVENF